MLATAIVLWFGGLAVARGDADAGRAWSPSWPMSRRFFQPIQELSQLYTTLQAAMAGGERVLELLDTPAGRGRPARRASRCRRSTGRVELSTTSPSPTGPNARGAARRRA